MKGKRRHGDVVFLFAKALKCVGKEPARTNEQRAVRPCGWRFEVVHLHCIKEIVLTRAYRDTIFHVEWFLALWLS